MQNIHSKLQYSGLASRLKSRKPISYRDVREPQNQKQPELAIAKIDPDLSEKEPSALITIILITATIFMYGLGIYQINTTVTSILQSMVEEVYQDSGLRGF